MGVVVREVCPQCKQDVYMPSACAQMRCPHCKKADIINHQRKSRRTQSVEEKAKRRFVFESYDIKATTCPKCGTNFTSAIALKKGKIFCPKCNNPMAPSTE